MLKIDTDCEKCGEGYTNVEERWCELCQIDNLKKSFVNWTSGSEILDDFIQELDKEDDFDPDLLVQNFNS